MSEPELTDLRVTKISWATHTFNAWSGCEKVSPGCKFCYAEVLPPSMRRDAEWGPEKERMPAGDSYWLQPLTWNAAAEADPLLQVRVFIGSTMDVGEARADLDPLRDRMLAMAALTPYIAKLLLTKRPAYLRAYLTAPGLVERVVEAGRWFDGKRKGLVGPDAEAVRLALQRLWIGFTAEDQERFDERIENNLATPGAIHFVSYEPALGPLDITKGLSVMLGEGLDVVRGLRSDRAGLDWVLAGGESGNRARARRTPPWFRALRDQCASARVQFHLKQWGTWAPRLVGDAVTADIEHGVRWQEAEIDRWHEPATGRAAWGMYRLGKADAGHLLDGVEHLALPTVGAANLRGLLRYEQQVMARYADVLRRP